MENTAGTSLEIVTLWLLSLITINFFPLLFQQELFGILSPTAGKV